MVKEFLDEQGAVYEVRNVAIDERARDEFLALGTRLPPVTVIGERVIEGFDPVAIAAALTDGGEDLLDPRHGV